MITDPTLIIQLFVNVEDARVLGVNDTASPPEVHVEIEREIWAVPRVGSWHW